VLTEFYNNNARLKKKQFLKKKNLKQ